MAFDVRSAAGLAALVGSGAGAAFALERGWWASVAVAAGVGAMTIGRLWSKLGTDVHRHASDVGTTAAPEPDQSETRAEQRLAAYLDLTPAPLVALDEDDRLHSLNRAARRLFHAEETISGQAPFLVATIADTSPGQSTTLQIGRAEDRRAYALVTADLTLGGEHTRIATLLDVEAELRIAEAAGVRELLQVLNHEIMNTLTPIASLSRTAVTMLNDDEIDLREVRDAVETVARRSDGLRRFVEDYATLARLPAPDRKPVMLNALIGDLRRLFETTWPGVRLRVRTRSVVVAGDHDQLSSAVWAILQNAAEAALSGAHPIVDLTLESTEEVVHVAISDSGSGLDPGAGAAIFQPFFTTKHGGSGIGLALSRQIVRAHGGDVLVGGSRGLSGACFEITMPRR